MTVPDCRHGLSVFFVFLWRRRNTIVRRRDQPDVGTGTGFRCNEGPDVTTTTLLVGKSNSVMSRRGCGGRG